MSQDLLSLEDRIEQDKEHFYVMVLDIRGRIKLVEVVFVGTLTSSLVHSRETFRRAIVEGAASIIIAHNHPSGEADPSDEDTKVTKQMFEAGKCSESVFLITLFSRKTATSVSERRGKGGGERINGYF